MGIRGNTTGKAASSMSNYPTTDYAWLARWGPRFCVAILLLVPIAFLVTFFLPVGLVVAITSVYLLWRRP
jgi:hypothetical protein